MDSIIDGSFSIVQQGFGSSSQQNSDKLGVFLVLLENGDLLRTDLNDLHRRAESNFFWGWSSEVWNSNCSNALAESLQVPLGGQLEAHELILLEVVQSKLVNGTGDDNNLDSSVSDAFNHFVEIVFLTLGEVEKVFSILNDDGSLGLTSLDFEWASVASNLAVFGGKNGSKGWSVHDHSVDQTGVVQRPSEDFNNPHIGDFEVFMVVWKGSDACLGNNLGEELVVARKLESWFEDFSKRVLLFTKKLKLTLATLDRENSQ